jgi:hypothetical protein
MINKNKLIFKYHSKYKQTISNNIIAGIKEFNKE